MRNISYQKNLGGISIWFVGLLKLKNNFYSFRQGLPYAFLAVQLKLPFLFHSSQQQTKLKQLSNSSVVGLTVIDEKMVQGEDQQRRKSQQQHNLRIYLY